MCEDCMEKVNGTPACSSILPPLLQDLRSCVQLMRSDAACKRDLALDKARPQCLQRNESHDQLELQC